jgi:DNA-binding cell septation regulator SpoVG
MKAAMKIEILSLRLIDPKESGLCGFADVQIDSVTVRDFRIFQRNGKPYIQVPHTTFKKDGVLQFHPIIDLPGELRGAVDAAILTAYFRKKEQTHEYNQR